jgi:amino acid adenylation domain-containing protein
LGEIEEVLIQHAAVEMAAVIARRGPDGNTSLFGYYTSARDVLEASELKAHLRNQLPDYMVPPRLVHLEVMPLTPNGKVDRKALEVMAERDAYVAVAEYIAPATETETALAAIWSDLLKQERVGVSDNFFDLGGHSLLAVQIFNRIQTVFHVGIELKDLFAYPTIRQLSAYIDDRMASGAGLKQVVIAKAPEREHYALSNAQKRLWFTYKLNPSSRAYNVPLEIAVKRALDVKLFERALEYLTQRHEALRTIFIEVDGEPRQAVLANRQASLFYKDVRNMDEAQQHHYIRETITLSESKPFDLAQGPLMRTMLFQRGEELYHFYLNLHHIITDGWSNELLAREISVIYEALEAGRTPELADVEIQYVDYAQWQEQEVQSGRWQQDESYWLETLAKPLPTLELPTDSERPEIQTDRGDVVYLTLPPELARGLRAQASEQEVSMFMLLLAGYVLFLHQHTRQDDIIVGTPMAGRLHQTLEPIIGFFVNTLAIRTRLEGVESVQDLVRRVKEQCLSAFEHQAYPFDLLIEKVNPERDLSRTPIFSTMFTYRQIAGLESSLYEPILPEEHEVSKFDLNVIVNEVNEAMSVRFEYNTDLFRRETVEQFAARWELALQALAGDTSAALRDLNLLTEQDRAVYASLNDTAVEYAGDRLLHEAFVEQAVAHPERVAVSCLGETMTYGELQERSNRLAHALREQGAAPNQLVAVLMERSLETLVALYGILKAGAAYVPIDPEYPEWRIRYMLANSEARVLITKGRYLADVSTIREELPLLETVLLVDDRDSDMAEGAEAAVPADVRVLPWSSIQEQPSATPERVNAASDLAYAIYTSGSTGQPKGTLVSHRAIGNLLNWLQAEFPLQEQDCVGQRTSVCFDASVWELFWPLAQGARMVIIPTEIVLETARLHALMAQERVSVLQFVPSLFNSFLYGLQNWKREQLPLPNLRYLFLGGEALPAKTVNQWYELFGTGVKIVNQYGPTEAAVDVACYVIDGPQTSIPIGRPVANTQLYVLDANGAPCPVNVPGELYIGGVQLAEGYHNNSAKTAEAFLPNHLSKQPGQRLYRTGDLAKVRPDGNLEYCGRLDNQVKVRGYRIELGEIEEVLGQHPEVELAAVLAMRGADGTNSLLGFYTTSRADLEAAELKQYLSGRLPDYMVPPRLFALDVMPLSPNGKIDRKALEALSAKRPQEAAKKAALPTNAMQEEILAIWQEVLQHDAFGIDDNFFDVGGHSIALAKVHSALREKLSVQVPLTDLFKYPTIQTLAEALTASQGKSAAKFQQAKKPAVKQEEDAVAIIGMSMRFPDASSPHEFWENLRNGVESVREFPIEELELTPFTQDPELRDQLIRVSALLDDIDKFDAGFFGIPEKEAMLMNPQHRLFLECAWEAIEDGGYNVEEIRGPVSVYGGCGGYEYLPRHGVPNLTRSELFQAILASQSRFLTSRVSYKLNLTGESLYVDTACSTSLVAIHMACQSLLNHQSDYALAGGASIQMPQKTGYIYEPGFVNSEDGHCRAFDKDASGTANGSGVGIVFLKRLSDALEDGDPIYAVIKGSAINNDGNMKIGYTAPSETGQMEVIAKAQAAAGVTPDDITYIEAHGTGTILGDPIEVRALTEVFREQTDRRQYCALGSVKTNVGHLDSAAGVAGLIKTVLALKHRELPPSLNFQAPNPALNLEQSPFYVNVTHKPWVTENNALRRAGVSSFGIGGTNAHVILEEAPSDEASRY